MQDVAELPRENRVALDGQAEDDRPEGAAAALLERADDDDARVLRLHRRLRLAHRLHDGCRLW